MLLTRAGKVSTNRGGRRLGKAVEEGKGEGRRREEERGGREREEMTAPNIIKVSREWRKGARGRGKEEEEDEEPRTGR